jgi:hypothetical protein
LVEIGTLLEPKFNAPSYYVGLFVCSHNPDVIEEAVFSNTQLKMLKKIIFETIKNDTK